MESNKSIHRSDEQKNLYKALIDAYESDKLILDTYEDTVSFKRHRDDEDKDEEPSAGSNWGSRGSLCWKRNRVNQGHQRKETFKNLASHMRITGTSNGLKIWSLTECRVKCRLAMTNMHSGESYIGGKKDNNSMDLLLTGNLLKKSTLNAVHLLDNDKLYKFKEGDFNRLHIQDIEDMLLLLVQGKLTNLAIEERLAFNVSLRMFTRSTESLKKEAYNITSYPETALNDRLKGIRIEYLPQTIWRQSDKDKAGAMI
ncbi:hypothetical protein Tco_0545913 [Tanacetum coccineum]